MKGDQRVPIKITLPADELYNSKTKQFIDLPEKVVEMEHSLVSVSKWEDFTGKAFLGPAEKTTDETFLYLHCMCLDDSVTLEDIRRIENHPVLFEQINEYIGGAHTATWFSEAANSGPRSREVVTAELVYHWMIAMQVDVREFQTWHLGRLFTLLKVINEKNKKPAKQSRQEINSKHRALMAKNRELAEKGLL